MSAHSRWLVLAHTLTVCTLVTIIAGLSGCTKPREVRSPEHAADEAGGDTARSEANRSGAQLDEQPARDQEQREGTGDRGGAPSADAVPAERRESTPLPQEPSAAVDHSSGDESDGRPANHLIHETSPYLLQHAHNPVQWYPWGPEAFEKARKEDKPVFLSVGYSTCYWCHVMEKQCFESEEVAEILNRNFVCIKVDREERPDVDEQYMVATQLLTGRGGWPNSVWLTPDGRPWMAGTYFPKDQFIEILQTLIGFWKTRRNEVEQQADQVATAIRRSSESSAALSVPPGSGGIGPSLIERALAEYDRLFDSTHGGFSDQPKFPPHGVLRVLEQEYKHSGSPALLRMITKTLDAMWLGGIHDHLGGGFHRYSTDSVWLLPHFEKMLYDNAQLMRAYADAYEATHESRYRRAVDDIYTWLARDMTSPEGAFFSALDSGEVGKEGEAYVWKYGEIVEVLGSDDGKLFAEVYHVEPGGNYREEATGEKTGANVLYLSKPIEQLAAERGVETRAFDEKLAALRARLLAHRLKRPQPHRDDKVLTSWNGLMIGALADAGRVLDEPKYTQAAARAADFVLLKLTDKKGRLLRTYRAGQAKLPGYLDDYAFFLEGLIDLHAATGDDRWRDEAIRLVGLMREQFEDKSQGGFFLTSSMHDDLLLRSKGLMGSGNIPSPNGIAAASLLRLGERTGDDEYVAIAERALDSFAGLMWQSPRAMDSGLYAASLAVERRAKLRLQAASLQDADATEAMGPVKAHVFMSSRQAGPGSSVQVAVALDVEPGWHVYGPNPEAEFVVPTTVEVVPGKSFRVERVRQPQAIRKRDDVSGETLAIMEGRVWYWFRLQFGEEIEPGNLPITIKVKTQACDASRCLAPQERSLSVGIKTEKTNGSSTRPRHPELFEGDDADAE